MSSKNTINLSILGIDVNIDFSEFIENKLSKKSEESDKKDSLEKKED